MSESESGRQVEMLWSLAKGFILGNCVLALLVYLEFWWKQQEHGKMLASKKKILDQIEVEQAQLKEKRKKEAAEKRKLEKMKQQTALEQEERARRQRVIENASRNPLAMHINRRSGGAGMLAPHHNTS